MMQKKRCFCCEKEKPLSDFEKRKRNKDGLMGKCKTCRVEYSRNYCYKNHTKISERAKEHYKKNKKKRLAACKEWREKNPDSRRRNLLKKYDLTIKDYDKMFKRQKGLCAICGLPEISKLKGKIKELAIDHNHNTGKIRGLLCSKCNQSLGLLKVDNLGILNLQAAIKYLKMAELK